MSLKISLRSLKPSKVYSNRGIFSSPELGEKIPATPAGMVNFQTCTFYASNPSSLALLTAPLRPWTPNLP
jgi:hypothetical protein